MHYDKLGGLFCTRFRDTYAPILQLSIYSTSLLMAYIFEEIYSDQLDIFQLIVLAKICISAFFCTLPVIGQ